MKKLLLPLFAGLLLAACQNATPTTPEAKTTEVPAEIKIDPAQIKEANTKGKTLLQDMNSFMSELNETASSLTAHKEEVEAIRSQLNDVIGKQEQANKGLELAENSAGTQGSTFDKPGAPTPGVIQDYIESNNNYELFLQDLRNQLEALKGSKAKGK